jgi:hypothetical protein
MSSKEPISTNLLHSTVSDYHQFDVSGQVLLTLDTIITNLKV